AFIPCAAGAIGRRRAMRVDANAAFEQASDARSLMPVQMSTAAGGKGDAVAAQEELAIRQCSKGHGQLLPRAHARQRIRQVAMRVGRSWRELPSPNARAPVAGKERERAFAVPRLAVAQAAPGDGQGA